MPPLIYLQMIAFFEIPVTKTSNLCVFLLSPFTDEKFHKIMPPKKELSFTFLLFARHIYFAS
jgi:hypothetical protein